MAASQTFTTKGGALGQKQSLADVMVTVLKDKVMLVREVAEGMKPLAPVHYFNSDTYGSPGALAAVEGAGFTVGAVGELTSNVNWTQIISKCFGISGTMAETQYGGTGDRLVYEKRKTLEIIGKGLEYAMINGSGNSGASGTAREMKGLLAWASANTACSSTAASGTALAGSAEQVKVDAMLQKMYENGTPSDVLMVSAASKRAIDQWTGYATRTYQTDQTTLIATFKIYQSSFGEVRIVLSTYMTDGYLFGVKMDGLRKNYLRKPAIDMLAKVGDSVDFEGLLEATMEFRETTGVAYTTLA